MIDKQEREDMNAIKIVGATEDKDFGSLKLSFFTIFNQ